MSALTVSGRAFSRAWRNALDIADEGSSRRYADVVHIEVHKGLGMRLVSTDLYSLLTQWVSSVYADGSGEGDPGFGAVPDWTTSIVDRDGLGRRFKRHSELTLSFAADGLTIGPVATSVCLPTAAFRCPDWRKLFPAPDAEHSDCPVWLNPRLLRRICDLRAPGPIEFGRPGPGVVGPLGPIEFRYGDMRGLVMPHSPPKETA